jgi:hypothetical protein
MTFGSEQLVWLVVLVGVVGTPALVCAVLYRAAIESGSGRRSATAVAAVAGGVLAGWLAVAAALADAGVFRQSPAAVRPWLGVAALGVLAALLLATGIPPLPRITRDPRMLTWPQVMRVVGGVFLIAWAIGDLPAVFALPAGLGDIAVGIAAVQVARRGRGMLAFHLLGLLDLVVAVGIGFLAGLGPHPLIDVTPSTEAVTRLPLVLIPVVLVPLAAALHIQALRRLRSAATVPALAS